MDRYDTNVHTLMDFLKAEGYSASVISAHRICFREYREYLISNNLKHSIDATRNWLARVSTNETARQIASKRHCLEQLEDVYQYGVVCAEHLGPRCSAYALLTSGLRRELDEYLRDEVDSSDLARQRIACSRFLFFLQEKGIDSLKNLDYGLLLSFHREDHHRSYKSKDVYEDIIRKYLRYHSARGNCAIGHSLALNKLLIDQIITMDQITINEEMECSGWHLTYDSIEDFVRSMTAAGYQKTVVNASRHILVLLYIFSDMRNIRVNERVIWAWFDAVKSSLGSGWKQHRRSLFQFILYKRHGNVVTNMTGDPDVIDKMNLLPEWFRVPLCDYLDLLRREGWKKSTLDMQKSSNLRFGKYLQNNGIDSFNQLTYETLKAFNMQDEHSTAEGKAAYNCRIRSFLNYLYDCRIISDPFLHRALPSEAAPKTRVVEILSENDLHTIWEIDPEVLTPIELRDYAIICVGLTMGFRASDIIGICFEDISWKKHCIGLTQAKTGRRIVMPMPVRTGNILFHYLKDARPKSSCNRVFIHHKMPFVGLRPGACRRALNRFLPNRETQNKGFHIARKTFATRLLRGSTNVELISDSLGHATDGTVHKYLSLDDQRMRMCPLSLEETGLSWRGGVFSV